MIVYVEGISESGGRCGQYYFVSDDALEDELMMDALKERAAELLTDFAGESVKIVKIEEDKRHEEF